MSFAEPRKKNLWIKINGRWSIWRDNGRSYNNVAPVNLNAVISTTLRSVL
jgi:hypothetical protein